MYSYVCCCRITPLLLPPRTWNLLTWTFSGHPATPVLTRWSLLLDAECSTSSRYAKLARCHLRDLSGKPLCLSLLLCRELSLAVAWAAWTQWKHLPLTSPTWTSQRTWRAVWIVQNRWAHVWSRFLVTADLLYCCSLMRLKLAEATQNGAKTQQMLFICWWQSCTSVCTHVLICTACCALAGQHEQSLPQMPSGKNKVLWN